MIIFQKVWNWRNWILSVPRVSVCRKKKSPWLRQYQSYISNWYVNGKVFTSTTTWEPKNLIFFSKKLEIEFDLYFDLCWSAEIIQVGLNMHLYVDIGDASSSLWGSTLVQIIIMIILWGHRVIFFSRVFWIQDSLYFNIYSKVPAEASLRKEGCAPAFSCHNLHTYLCFSSCLSSLANYSYSKYECYSYMLKICWGRTRETSLYNFK